MLGQHHGDAEVVHEPGDRGEHVLGAGRVERRGGFVEHQHPRMRGQRGADRDPLLLAAGQGAQRPAAQVGDAEQVERLLAAGAHRGRVDRELLHRVGEFFFDGVGDEAGQRVLADQPDHVGEFARRKPGRVPAVHQDPARQRAAGEVRHEAVDGAEQRGLAAAGRADHQAQLAFVDPQGDVGQHGRGGVVVLDTDPVELDHELTPVGRASNAGSGAGGLDGAEISGGGAATAATAATRMAAAGSSGSVGHCSG